MKVKTLALVLAAFGLLIFTACSTKVQVTIKNSVAGDLLITVSQQEDSESVLSQTLFDGMMQASKDMVITVEKGYITVTAEDITGDQTLQLFSDGNTIVNSQQFGGGGLFGPNKVTATINPGTTKNLVGVLNPATNTDRFVYIDGTIIFTEE